VIVRDQEGAILQPGCGELPGALPGLLCAQGWRDLFKQPDELPDDLPEKRAKIPLHPRRRASQLQPGVRHFDMV
jgi:hypothetical protein